MPFVFLLALAAAPADYERCRQAVSKVESHDAPERIDAIQACGVLMTDQELRGAWFSVVHTSPFDAAPILGTSAGAPLPGGAPNACSRSKSDLDICRADRDKVLRMRAEDRATQWRILFFRLLDADLPRDQVAATQKVFLAKWPLLFPEAPPPGVSNDGELKVSGNIDRLAVMRGIGEVRPAIDKCLASPESELTLKWTISAQGKVTGFFVVFPSEPERADCITKAFKKAVMPKPPSGGVAIIVWTPERL